jgi:hypothetical protein
VHFISGLMAHRVPAPLRRARGERAFSNLSPDQGRAGREKGARRQARKPSSRRDCGQGPRGEAERCSFSGGYDYLQYIVIYQVIFKTLH